MESLRIKRIRYRFSDAGIPPVGTDQKGSLRRAALLDMPSDDQVLFSSVSGTRFGSLEVKIGSLESEKLIIGSLKSEKSGSYRCILGT